MINLETWISTRKDKPFLIAGKGDSLPLVANYNTDEFYTIAINQAIFDFSKVDVCFIIDYHKVQQCFKDFWKINYLMMPWRPHINYIATDKTLEHLIVDDPILADYENSNSLLVMNLNNGRGNHSTCVSVSNYNFAGDVTFQLLCRLGIKDVYTIGLNDSKYSETMKGHFRSERIYDVQKNKMQSLALEFGVSLRRLNSPDGEKYLR